MSVGVMLTRAQPFHLGHIKVLQKIASENDKVLLIVGSANKEGTKRNPFPISLRLQMVKEAVDYYMPLDKDRIQIVPMNDWSMEDFYSLAKEWGNFFYYTVVYFVGVKKFRFYYNDDVNIVKNWFQEDLQKRVEICTLNRTITAGGVSSTYLRERILKGDYESVKPDLLESVTKEQYEELKAILKQVEENPKEDYMME